MADGSGFGPSRRVAINALRDAKKQNERYRLFQEEFDRDPASAATMDLAREVWPKYRLGIDDYKTAITDAGRSQALETGVALSQRAEPPEIIFYSSYLRTRQTLYWMRRGWRELREVPAVPDDRIREQEHGLVLLYNDWRIFQAMHPEQRALRQLQGPYWYQCPQGESVSQVRDRGRSFFGMLIRECAGMRVMVITHHLTILSFRANLERLRPERFTALDERQKPINCGITRYVGVPNLGNDGKLILDYYNKRLY